MERSRRGVYDGALPLQLKTSLSFTLIPRRKREQAVFGNPNTQARRRLQTGLDSNLGIGGTVWVR